MAPISKKLADLRCATNAEIREWLKFWAVQPAKHRSGRTVLDTFCGDCSLAYVAAMQAAGKCIRRRDFNPEKNRRVVEAYEWPRAR